MPTNVEKQTLPDADNPAWTAERFARAKRLDAMPASVQRAAARQSRGPQKAPTKRLISIRLSPDVLSALQAKGRGWQKLADDALREEFVKRG